MQAGFGRATSLIVLAAAGLAGCDLLSDREPDAVDITALDARELADYLVLETDSYRLDQSVQEGGTGRDRMTQDEIQRLCSFVDELDGETASRVIAAARASYQRPEDGIQLGDWRIGAELARSGYGYRVGHNTDAHGSREPGGNCYACHQMDPAETAYGTIGPSLSGYVQKRGNDEAVVQYVHELIHNPHQYFPCTHMPRFGSTGFLNEEQISHLMAYLLDSDSPINQ